ncbi:MAG: T9SS type A sorting domain-containing protein [Ignavibacteriaceae bacterium]|nr:T9SS type A sorting domain-containing protein [Ignavibacteriaceae bacterium]MCW9097019.1 T9SS type A sorting domain-containing protein [Ignavibacteriaceae bacterium]
MEVRNMPSGIYFYKLATNNFSQTKKMILLK